MCLCVPVCARLYNMRVRLRTLYVSARDRPCARVFACPRARACAERRGEARVGVTKPEGSSYRDPAAVSTREAGGQARVGAGKQAES